MSDVLTADFVRGVSQSAEAALLEAVSYIRIARKHPLGSPQRSVAEHTAQAFTDFAERLAKVSGAQIAILEELRVPR